MSAVPAARSIDRLPMHRRRKAINIVAIVLSLGAMSFGIFWLIWILLETVRLGIGGLAWPGRRSSSRPRRRTRKAASRTPSSAPRSW